jgi:hypothetical protein
MERVTHDTMIAGEYYASNVSDPRRPQRVDPDRARELLASERERIEQAIAELEESVEADDQGEANDAGSETLYEDELDERRAIEHKQVSG